LCQEIENETDNPQYQVETLTGDYLNWNAKTAMHEGAEYPTG